VAYAEYLKVSMTLHFKMVVLIEVS